MNLFQIITLSIIEGFTEFLPISSTGHLILAQHFLGIDPSEFTKTFDIVIQFSAILAVVYSFRRRLTLSPKLWQQALVAFIPTGIVGLILYRFIRDTLLENPLITVYSLFLGGIVLLIVDRLKALRQGQNKILDLNISQLIRIGLFQAVSVIPGVSRSAASIVGGLSTGLSRSHAVEFSFFLAIPTMFASTGYDLLKSGLSFTAYEYLLLSVGCLFSFVSALAAIKFLLEYVKKHDFTLFATYRIVLALIVFFILNP